jgi:hypothetical protein
VPSSSDSCACQDPVEFLPLKPDPRAQHHAAGRESNQNFARGTKRFELIGEKERDAQNQNDDAQLVQPVRAQHLFHVER